MRIMLATIKAIATPIKVKPPERAEFASKYPDFKYIAPTMLPTTSRIAKRDEETHTLSTLAKAA